MFSLLIYPALPLSLSSLLFLYYVITKEINVSATGTWSFLLIYHPLCSDATIYVGGLDDKVSEGLLWELFVQAGPVVNVHMPKDRVTQQHQGYGFVEFMGEEDADYAIKIMNMIKVCVYVCLYHESS